MAKIPETVGKAGVPDVAATVTKGRNLVVLCDGTGNELGGALAGEVSDIRISNVLKLYRIAEKGKAQLIYYTPGVGTIGRVDWLYRWKQKLLGVLGLVTGYGLDDNVLGGYRFLVEHWQEGDRIYLFGFSRGAWTARVLGGLIQLIGLIRPSQLNMCENALATYKRAAQENRLPIAWHFARVIGSRFPTIRFVGVWDTVASVLVPRGRPGVDPEPRDFALHREKSFRPDFPPRDSARRAPSHVPRCELGSSLSPSSPTGFARRRKSSRTSNSGGFLESIPTSAAAIQNVKAPCRNDPSSGWSKKPRRPGSLSPGPICGNLPMARMRARASISTLLRTPRARCINRSRAVGSHSKSSPSTSSIANGVAGHCSDATCLSPNHDRSPPNM